MKKKHIHILAICGYTTSGLALMAKKLGYIVTGSDEDAYPPNSTVITDAGIKWSNFHSAENLNKWGRPDLVIQGNQIRARNRELLEAKRAGIPVISDSEFFYELTKKRKRVVVCGSHGKTTVSSLISWILEKDGRNPGFRLGSVTKNFNTSVRIGGGAEFVFEGDEYTTTYKDKRPKFFHFHPNIAVINNIEWDHPDVFKSSASYRWVFKKYLVSKMGRKGLLVVNGGDPNVKEVTKKSPCKVLSFGLNNEYVMAKSIKFDSNSTSFNVVINGKNTGRFKTSLSGNHNVLNSLAAITVANFLGVSIKNCQKALKTFKGASRRFEVVGKNNGITVIDDYAHHPTKARETIAGARLRYPNSKIFVVYVPHTFSRTKTLLSQYAQAFKEADYTIFPDIEPARERNLQQPIHSLDLVSAVREFSKNVHYLPGHTEIFKFIRKFTKDGDIVLCMSVRGFDNFARKLLESLAS